MFLAAYVGPSMNPTLREPESMEVLPYGTRQLRIGDVAFFLPPGATQPIVHRIIRITPAGISTLGDNNSREDAFLLQPENIQGQVVAAWRGQKRRTIAGGMQGRLTSRWFRWRRALDLGVSPMLHPLYQAVSRWGLIARLLPARFKPRIVVFQVLGQKQYQILLGQRVIGRYDDQRQQWLIQRPFHLLVDGRALPKQHDIHRTNRRVTADRQKTIDRIKTQRVVHNLALADGSHWEILAADDESASIVAQVGSAMQLRATTGAIESAHTPNSYKLLVQVDPNSSVLVCYIPLPSKSDGVVNCILSPRDQWDGPFANLVRLSLVFARLAQAKGGTLIHGALAERDGIGIIMTAPGGTGKSTASSRIPAPWRSLCDDTTLVVRDPQGKYWAHPWPTWSRFLEGGPGGSWDVQEAVPLKSIFFLDRAVVDSTERLGPGHAVSMLVQSAGQVSSFMTPGLNKEELRAQHLERFNNLCSMARAIPAHVLHISMTGTFWLEIEKALAQNNSDEGTERGLRFNRELAAVEPSPIQRIASA